MESVIISVRGLCVSSKFPIPLNRLDNEYRVIIGEKIPYGKFGFNTLADFLQSDPSLKVFKENGEFVVTAERSDKTKHIADMVKKQKYSKPKQPSRRRFPSKPATTSKWQPKQWNSPRINYAKPARPAAISHTQFTNYQKPIVASKIVIPENSNYNKNVRFQRQESMNNRLQLTNKQENSVTAKENLVLSTTSTVKQRESSPGSSVRRRITKMMSEINLERDSGNSSPTSDNGIGGPLFPFKNPERIITGDPKIDLNSLVDYHKLGVVDITTSKVNTKRDKFFTCKLKVGTYSCTSYPNEFHTQAEAEAYCYKEALAELTSKYGKRKSLVLTCDRDILERIPKMLEKHSGGVWESQLRLDYADKFNEELPEDWLKIIDSSPCIHVLRVCDGYVLKHCKPEEVLQKGNMWNIKSMALGDVSVPSNTIDFGEDGKLFAEIQLVMSANEIWCRQYDTEESDKFLTMIANMEEFYSICKNNLKATTINQYGYYVAESNDNNWFRVRALSVTETHVCCFYIDYGHEILLPKSRLHQMKREFATCQAQAFVCCLAGLEELYDISVDSDVLRDSLRNKQVILEIATEVEVSNGAPPPVYMYDFETGDCLNEQLVQPLTIESASIDLQIDTINDVHISYIAKNGDIYIQIHSQGFLSLMQLIKDLETEIINNPSLHLLEPINKKNSQDKIYLGRYSVDGHWHRLKIIDWSPKEDLVQIHFIDYGHTDVINVDGSVLYPLDKVSDVLNLYPPQAIKTRMLLDYTPADFLSITEKAIPKNESVIMKIIKFNENVVPLAEFFKRNPDGSIFCINKSINIENEIRRSDTNNNSKNTIKALTSDVPKNVPSGGKLKCPTLPPVKESFQIHIPFAVNPYNFFVQPLNYHSQLNKMMKKLQEKYKSVMYSPLTIDDIIPGNIYASKFDDGHWYRTSVIKVIHDGSISVFYCDYGYYSNLTLQQLIPLDIEFMELPYLALKARLSNIKPKHSNWTMEHCDEFKDLVERKSFYSVLLKIEKDQLYDSDLVLDLILIDTSTSDDIYIEQELIKKGIAIKA